MMLVLISRSTFPRHATVLYKSIAPYLAFSVPGTLRAELAQHISKMLKVFHYQSWLIDYFLDMLYCI